MYIYSPLNIFPTRAESEKVRAAVNDDASSFFFFKKKTFISPPSGDWQKDENQHPEVIL